MSRTKDFKKMKELKKEINTYSKGKKEQDQKILDSMNYRKALATTSKWVILISVVLCIVTLIVMWFITKTNILALKEGTLKGYLNVVDYVFLFFLFDVGLSFTITGFRKIPKAYKKKTIITGIEVIVFTIFLGLIFTGVLL